MDAISHGFASVEADILLRGDTLFVGHDRSDLDSKPLMLFEDHYLKPLLDRYERFGGIYPMMDRPFYLWVDIKYDGSQVLDVLTSLVGPYEKMLAGKNVSEIAGKVMLIISGDRPINRLLLDDTLFFYLDGRPEDAIRHYPQEHMPFVSQHIKYICTTSPEGTLNKTEHQKLVTFVDVNHTHGYKVRLWATPENEKLWDQLVQANVDLINTDQLEKLSTYLQNIKE